MGRKIRVAVAVVLALALGVAGFFIGSSYDDGRDARFAVDISGMPGVDRVALYGAEISQVSFERGAEVGEVLAVRDRLEDKGIDPTIDVGGVYGRWLELDEAAPTMIAVAQVSTQPASVRVRKVRGLWVEARMADTAQPADGAEIVLRILREFVDKGVPDDVEVVGANTRGEQLDLVFVQPEALRDLESTVASLAAIVDAGPTTKVECDEDGCQVAPFKEHGGG